MPIDVFISYRGADRVLARKLALRLRSRWGSRVYRDETSLIAGRSWSEQLNGIIEQAKVTLALIGPGWHIRAKGEDWVRDELLGAIEAGKSVLPVLVGDPDKRKGQLGDLPEAFQQQAISVSEDLAGFDLYNLEKALRNLGAFGDRFSGGFSHELSETLPDQCQAVIDEVLEGKSVVISGASGSGRAAMLQRIADAVKEQGNLVATSGIDLGSRHRRTHSVVASWVDDICMLYKARVHEDHMNFGLPLVKAILEFGPDLLARRVLRPELLLPLGEDESDQKILEAAQRPTDRWAPFPPERLVSQSVSVIKNFVAKTGLIKSDVRLTLIVDNVESIDGSSKNLLRRLIKKPIDNVCLVIATSAVKEKATPETPNLIAARALNMNLEKYQNSFAKFKSISMHDAEIWGEPGAVMKGWLGKHNVELDDGISRKLTDSNPYYALSTLWYLVENGHLTQIPPSRPVPEGQKPSSDSDGVTWVPASADEKFVIPTRDRLLDHMVEEFVPASYRPIIEAGSLMGRRFLFSAAFAAAHPPRTIDGHEPRPKAINQWRDEADKHWAQLKEVDPEGSVLVCHLSADNERMISLAQTDLVQHFANQLDSTTKIRWHRRIAQYFRQPLADDSSYSLDDRYRNARAQATHWANANAHRDAGDAERVAAGLAEEALAYPEARRHYGYAIRLFTQIIANKEYKSTLNAVDHQDLLILADCLYRLGQMTRLAYERGHQKNDSAEPVTYFRDALERLQELSEKLHDKESVAPTCEPLYAFSPRDIPEPNPVRHYIRLCEARSGRIKLEMAECEADTHPDRSRDLLFDALRHAEAARGEADSRSLLAAASVQLAERLVDDALDARRIRKKHTRSQLGNRSTISY